jgi:short-subunit dehydrogenase involved in D-alanine esterification of teichoic acids
MPQSTINLIDAAVVTGGNSGIGKAIASSLIQAGKKVILVGRSEDSLKAATKELDAAAYYILDTGNVEAIPHTVDQILKSHPDVNCLINNAGVQRPFQFPNINGKGTNQEYSFDLARADEEVAINVRGPMYLCVKFLEHFTALPDHKQGVIMNVSSILGFLPSSTINPCYNGTKAWVHMFSTNMRTQYAKSGKIKVVEIAPPSVTTALHRDRTDPNDNSKEKNKTAMSVDDFMDEVRKGWEEGKDVIAPGPAGVVVDAWYQAMGERYEKATQPK